MLRRPEGSTIVFTAYSRSAAKALTPLTSARYRETCETTGRTVTDWTALTVANPGTDTSVVITLTPTQTAILNRGNRIEQKRLTVEITNASGTATNEYPFEVSRLNIG